MRGSARSSLPERRREQRQDGEDLESPEQHADREDAGPEGVDYLEALGGPYLVESGPDVVEGCRDGSRRGGKREVVLQRH